MLGSRNVRQIRALFVAQEQFPLTDVKIEIRHVIARVGRGNQQPAGGPPESAGRLPWLSAPICPAPLRGQGVGARVAEPSAVTFVGPAAGARRAVIVVVPTARTGTPPALAAASPSGFGMTLGIAEPAAAAAAAVVIVIVIVAARTRRAAIVVVIIPARARAPIVIVFRPPPASGLTVAFGVAKPAAPPASTFPAATVIIVVVVPAARARTAAIVVIVVARTRAATVVVVVRPAPAGSLAVAFRIAEPAAAPATTAAPVIIIVIVIVAATRAAAARTAAIVVVILEPTARRLPVPFRIAEPATTATAILVILA
jgi:hypothetical protein